VSALPETGPRWQSRAALGAWLLVFAWLALIFFLSSESFSEPSTGSLLRPFLRWLFPEWSSSEIRALHHAIRKAAHMGVYAVLALLSFRALRFSLAAGALRLAGLALALVLGAAATDEFLQSFSRSRTGSPSDVGYDLAGALLALALLLWWRRQRAGIRSRSG
jgi:VanZ family protein